MSSPLRLLRNWLPFGDRQAAHTDLEALRIWLDGHTRAPAAEMATGLASRIPGLAAREKNLHMRLRLLETFSSAADEILPRLEEEITRAPLPLPAAARSSALAADNLLKALASAYAAAVAAIESRRLATGLGRLLHASLLRALQTIGRRQELAYRVYANPSAGTWQQLHQLHALARSRNLGGTNKSGDSIEQAYVRALLLAFADPCKHSRADLQALATCCRRLAPLARLRHAGDLPAGRPQTRALFLLGSDGQPGRPLPQQSSWPADALALDAGAIVDCLEAELAQGPRGDPSCPPELGEALIALWSGQPSRRFSRARFKPKADLVTGVPAVAGYLYGAFARRRSDRQEKAAVAISEWYIVNQSPDGFGLRYTQGDAGSLDVGDLVGLRPRERSRVHICLIRRVSNTGHGRFELGLQELSPLALPIPLKAGNGILLPRLPGFGNAAGLAAPAGLLSVGSEVAWSRNGRSFRHRLGRRVDGNRHTDLFLLA
jgi:hypothetical protein